MMDTQRLVLFVIFSFSLFMLWEAWQKENRPPPAAVARPATNGGTSGAVPASGGGTAKAGDVPTAGAPSVAALEPVPGASARAVAAAAAGSTSVGSASVGSASVGSTSAEDG